MRWRGARLVRWRKGCLASDQGSSSRLCRRALNDGIRHEERGQFTSHAVSGIARVRHAEVVRNSPVRGGRLESTSTRAHRHPDGSHRGARDRNISGPHAIQITLRIEREGSWTMASSDGEAAGTIGPVTDDEVLLVGTFTEEGPAPDVGERCSPFCRRRCAIHPPFLRRATPAGGTVSRGSAGADGA
jgi:hypothetical protein